MTKKDLNVDDPTIEEYLKYLNLPEIDNYKKFNMIKGFYEESLKDNRIIEEYNFKKPIFINIDCDIYTSTLQVLDFIFRNKLYENGKTIIRYDDWGVFLYNLIMNIIIFIFIAININIIC